MSHEEAAPTHPHGIIGIADDGVRHVAAIVWHENVTVLVGDTERLKKPLDAVRDYVFDVATQVTHCPAVAVLRVQREQGRQTQITVGRGCCQGTVDVSPWTLEEIELAGRSQRARRLRDGITGDPRFGIVLDLHKAERGALVALHASATALAVGLDVNGCHLLGMA